MFNLQAEKEECKVFSIQDITREEFKQGTSFKIQYCAKVMQAKCANFVLCSRELSSEISLESSSVNSGRFERNFA